MQHLCTQDLNGDEFVVRECPRWLTSCGDGVIFPCRRVQVPLQLRARILQPNVADAELHAPQALQRRTIIYRAPATQSTIQSISK